MEIMKIKWNYEISSSRSVHEAKNDTKKALANFFVSASKSIFWIGSGTQD